MERYSEYCESGTGWLGELPSHWQLRRISALYDARNEKVSDRDYPPLSVTMQGIVPQLETAAKTQDGDNRKLVRCGDFVINSRSDRRGACGISAYDGSVTLISNVLAPKDRDAMSTRYYSYLFRSEGFADEFYRQGTGIVDDLWSTNWSRMKNILVSGPPHTEQERIADYLDIKTAEIDALVADCEREVGLLQEYRKAIISEVVTKGLDPDAPMKDSGVEWIGEIPVSWKILKLKQLAKKIGDGLHGTPDEYDENGEVWFINGNNLGNQVITLKPDTKRLSASERDRLQNIEFSENTILISLNGSYGETSFYNGEAVLLGKSAGFVVLNPEVDKHYIRWYLQSHAVKTELDLSLSGTTIANVSLFTLNNLTIVYPPPNEQQRINAHLGNAIYNIDSLVEAKQQMADKLREYRKSLVSEAVTGKFKVPGVK